MGGGKGGNDGCCRAAAHTTEERKRRDKHSRITGKLPKRRTGRGLKTHGQKLKGDRGGA